MFQAENEFIEYKEKLTDSLEKEVVAFLNAKGGSIYIGVKDNGDVVGLPNIDKDQLQIKDRLIYGIAPAILPLFTISTEYIDGKAIIKISIKEGVEKPYYIKNKGLSELGAFIRIGSSAHPMPHDMIYSFQSRLFPKSLTVTESPEQELSFAELFIHYRRFNKPLNDITFAQTLNFLTKDGKYNYLAYLMADNNQVSVRFARFNDAGKRFELIEKGIEYGNCCLITAIQRILDRFEIENITLSRLTGAAHRIDKRLADNKCLREVIINAFAHNDYSYGMLPIFEVFQNRFAVRSYGGLVPQLTINEFFLGVSALRNPELMRILKDVELVEALGFGIREITRIYDREIFVFTNNTVYVELPFDGDVVENNEDSKDSGKDSGKGKGISKGISKDSSKGKVRENSKGKILKLIVENPKIKVAEIAEIIGISVAGAEKNIRLLKQESKIFREDSKKNSQWIVEKSKDISKGSGKDASKGSGKVKSKDIGKGKEKVRENSKGKILEMIIENPKIKVSEIAETIGISIAGVEKNIRLLKQEGRIFREDSKKNSQWIVEKSKDISKGSGKGISKGISKGNDISKGKVRENSKGKILKLILENPKIKVPEIAETIGISIAGVEKNIRLLKKEGAIARTDDTKSGVWIVI